MSRRSKLLGSYSSFKPENKFKKKLGKLVKTIILFFIAYQVFTVFIVSSFTLNTSAMEPGILKGQHVLSAPFLTGASIDFFKIKIPGFKEPARGDLVLIRPGNASNVPWYVFVLDPVVRFFTLQKKTIMPNADSPWNNQLSVKRIIGIPGDTIKMVNYMFVIKDNKGNSYNSEQDLIHKKYSLLIPEGIPGMESSFPFSGNMEALKLKEGEYFLANDNRSAYYDSRFYGPVQENNILGPVFLTYSPGFSFK